MKKQLTAATLLTVFYISKNINSIKITILPLCLLALLFTFPARTFVVEANAATITVNSASDAGTNGDGLCTLREAILNANADNQSNVDCAGGAGADTINFNASLANQTITMTSPVGQFSITSSMTINGSAAANLSVSGNNASRVFSVSANSTVVMTGFRLTAGNGNGSQGGGAILNNGDLTLNNMIVQANGIAETGLGGGIRTEGTGNRLTVSGGSILDNMASRGGAIYGDGTSINLSNVTISGNTVAFVGGGISTNGGTLNVTGGSVTGNTAVNSAGGGIYASNTAVTVTNASITNNRADGSDGGGMYITGGSSTITDSTFSGNTTRRTGGGIYFVSGAHSVTGTTLSGNSTASGSIASVFRGGGGLANQATLNIANSTVSGNSSGCDCGGGGLSTFNGGTTTLRNVTIANNAASAGSGGGIQASISGVASGTINIGNTIVADNTATANPDVNGAIVSQGFNLVRMRGTSTGYVASDLPNGSNPMLEALGSNGGPTQTHRLLAGGAAIDTGSNALAVNPSNGAALTTDQRGAGFPRIVDGNGDLTATVDIGAFEAPLGTTAAGATVSGQVTTGRRGLNRAIVYLQGQDGSMRIMRTNPFGYFQFEDVEAGQTYIVSVMSKRYQFVPQVITVTGALDNLLFTPLGTVNVVKSKNELSP